MIWLVILSMLVMAAYTAAVCIKQKGVPYSISATYYKLERSLVYGYNVADCRIVDAGRAGSK